MLGKHWKTSNRVHGRVASSCRTKAFQKTGLGQVGFSGVSLAVHSGLILRDELKAFDVTPAAFAQEIGVPHLCISQVIAGERSVAGDLALRFGRWFGVDPQFWLNLQEQFDVAVAARAAANGAAPAHENNLAATG